MRLHWICFHCLRLIKKGMVKNMALDGIMLRSLITEFNNILKDGRVEKVNQPERDVVMLYFHLYNKSIKNARLVLSVNPACPGTYISTVNTENPKVPPNFCMLLRKHLNSARLIHVNQVQTERVVYFKFECGTELYETVYKYLILEIMGRASNLILTDSEFHIIDSVKHTDFTDSSKRQILPGFKYTQPPSQEKIDISDFTDIGIIDFNKQEKLDKTLLNTFMGFAPLLCREICFRAMGRTDAIACELTENDKFKLNAELLNLKENIQSGTFSPVVLFDKSPFEFYCFDIKQYGDYLTKRSFNRPSEALDAFYEDKSKSEHIKRASADISKILAQTIARVTRKAEAQRGDLAEYEKSSVYKHYGDLITSNIYRLKGGEREVSVIDYYADEPCEKTLALDPRLSPVQNAQKYYKMYKKAQNAIKVLSEQIPASLNELAYLESVSDELDRAENISDINEIRTELAEQGYIKQNLKQKYVKNNKGRKDVFNIMEFMSGDGFQIFVGKNNLQNDYLTLKIAEKRDIWFHVKNYAGSHVILRCNGRSPSDKAMTEAAVLAATYSKIKDSFNVEVDYTEVRNVKKPSGAKPGMVVYEVYKTAIVTPSEKLINELIVKK